MSLASAIVCMPLDMFLSTVEPATIIQIAETGKSVKMPKFVNYIRTSGVEPVKIT